MHVSDGLLPAPVCIGGYGLTSLITWVVLRRLDRRPNPSAEIPKASLLTAAFFVSSSLYIPIPPVSVHLILNGLLGSILDLYAFPAILIGLLFQALVFGHGGLSTLGVNALIMGLPALIAAQVFRWGLPDRQVPDPKYRSKLGLCGFLAAVTGVSLSVLSFFGLILSTIPLGDAGLQERQVLWGLCLAHVPVIVLEGVVTSLVVLFLDRVKPSLLPNPYRSRYTNSVK